MRTLRKIGMMASVVLVPLFATLAVPAIADGPIGSACGLSDQLYRIDKISSCDRECPSYNPVAGCWCFQLPAIIVEG